VICFSTRREKGVGYSADSQHPLRYIVWGLVLPRELPDFGSSQETAHGGCPQTHQNVPARGQHRRGGPA
jgi:hypothetical protein